MSVALRLFRLGKKDNPFYRIVAIDKRKKRQGKYIEVVGIYNPMTNTPQIKIKKERLDYWVSRGAIISEGLEKLLKNKKKIIFKTD